jgi:transposase-like protein
LLIACLKKAVAASSSRRSDSMKSMGFKAFHSAQATIAGIETAHMIRKGQLSEDNIPAYKQFMALAG